MVNPTIKEAGHYNPQTGKCPVCRVWWGMHSIEEENDHAIKILDWLEKNEKARKIFEEDSILSILYDQGNYFRGYYKKHHERARNVPAGCMILKLILDFGEKKGAFTVKEIREYFKNIPPVKGTLTKEERRDLQIEIERKNRKEQQAIQEMLRKYSKI